MSLKTMIAVLQVATKKRLAENRNLWNSYGPLIPPGAHKYHEGYQDALEAVLRELDLALKAVQEEGL